VEATASVTDSVEREKLYLYPGQMAVSTEPTVVTTILGSCVSVCLWDPSSGLGGVNHFLLPLWAENVEDELRFGSRAVPRLVEALRRQGATASRLQAKVFGGASILNGSGAERLGTKNVAIARECLDRAGIPIVASDVLGERGRKLLFHTDDGTAFVKQL
jgi:chemotaxis protein CheD